MTLLNTPAQEVSPLTLDAMYRNMQVALKDYREAFAKHKNLQMYQETSSTIVDVAHAEMEHYRAMYLSARIEYERAYGNLDAYRDAYSRVADWSIESGIKTLVRPLTSCEQNRIFS